MAEMSINAMTFQSPRPQGDIPDHDFSPDGNFPNVCAICHCRKDGHDLTHAALREIEGTDNTTCYRIGLLCREVAELGADKAGDEIDRGLIFMKRLRSIGFRIVPS